MMATQTAAYVDSRPVNEHDVNLGFCELNIQHVSERYCLYLCKKDICFHYPFDRKLKAATVQKIVRLEHRRERDRGIYKRKFERLRELFGGRCWWCGSTEKLEFAHLTETKLSGHRGRGMPQRYHDIVNNPESYGLGCHDCHVKFDAGELTREDWKF